MKSLFIVAAIAALAPLAAHAESRSVTTGDASASLIFRITIPRILFLQVGTGTLNAIDPTQNTLDFTVPDNGIGNGTPVLATGGNVPATGSATGLGGVTIRVSSNTGNAQLTNSTTALQRTSGGAIPWNNITVVADALPTANASPETASFTNGVIAHPTFAANSGSSTTTTTLHANPNGVVRQEGRWTFAYANNSAPPGGVYTGTATYTLTAP